MLSRRSLLRLAGSTAAASLAFTGFAGANESAQYVVEGRGKARKRVERAGFSVKSSVANGSLLLVEGPADEVDQLSGLPGVKHASRNPQYRLASPPQTESFEDSVSEPLYPLQWDKQVTDTAEAHDVTTGEGASVAVLDTGVHYDHPDLAGNIDADAGRLFRGGEVYSGTERDVVVPVDRGNPEAGTTTVSGRHVADDAQYHGTHVAGIAAAAANDVGVVGTAPDASVVSLRVFYWDEAGEPEEAGDPPAGTAILTTTTFDILQAIEYAATVGADVANMSLGTPPLQGSDHSDPSWSAYQTVIQRTTRQGTLVVASAGNAEADLQHGGTFSLPNSTAGAISVSATAPNDELVFFSNYGTNEIDLGAPGGGYETQRKTLCLGDGTVAGCDPTEEGTDSGDCECEAPAWPYPQNLILSTVPPRSQFGAAYGYVAGTSMSAPQVSGTVALVRSMAPDAKPNQVEKALLKGAEGANGRSDPRLGAGRLDVLGAVQQL